jgi:thiol-disulfide isomerase/thioredoxin
MMNKQPESHPARTGLATALWAAALAAVAGYVAIYVTLGRYDNVESKIIAAYPPPTNRDAAEPTSQADVSTMAAFVFKKAPERLPDVKFVDRDGRERVLADFTGKVVLLNLWATWCAPCRNEMPALDRLQKDLGSATFEVVAVNVDRLGVGGARKFLEQLKLQNLSLYADPSARMVVDLKAVGLPTTLLVDKESREIGRFIGPAAWDSADAKQLIRAQIQ